MPRIVSLPVLAALLAAASAPAQGAATCEGFYATYGAGVAGAGEWLPQIVGSGCPDAGQQLSVVISSGFGGASGALLIGSGRAAMPLMGGSLLTWPIRGIAHVLVGTGVGAGTALLSLPLPAVAAVAGSVVNCQALYLDPGADAGVSMTQGLEATIGRPAPGVRFAVIGDYGLAGVAEANVAALVGSWNPDFVITTGDNNYPDGDARTIDQNVGQFYRRFIGSYSGGYGAGAATNRFFPALGNHDWDATGAQPYLDYFSLPGNERYYDFVWGPVHLFAVDSDAREPDGITATSVQAAWLQRQFAASTAPLKIVYLHHAPFSSAAKHGSNPTLQWPFAQWGADAVLAGHEHTYERLEVGGLPYFVVGLSGSPQIYSFLTPLPQSRQRFNLTHGAMLAEVRGGTATFCFVTHDGAVVDTYAATAHSATVGSSILVPAGSRWRYLDDGSNQGVAWRARQFEDETWAAGPAPLGYGNGVEATVVSFGSNPAGKHMTTYFRRAFEVKSLGGYRRLVARLLCDDGASVYLNGVEVSRNNLPFSGLSYLSPAYSGVTGVAEVTFGRTNIDLGLLRVGANVLAVEVHQVDGASSDLSFDLELIAEF